MSAFLDTHIENTQHVENIIHRFGWPRNAILLQPVIKGAIAPFPQILNSQREHCRQSDTESKPLILLHICWNMIWFWWGYRKTPVTT